MNANTSHKGTGCGCGGGATTTAAICSCGGGGCASCQGQGIVRPRFFAGQLLTEDDLQLLTDYSIQKNRLHNRYLFGAGVVCGLEVTCDPCGNGHVIVHPGYALDCCGNDLTLDCATPLNVNKMIRDLRRDQLGGFDCGDPCPEPITVDADSKASTDPAASSRVASGAGRAAGVVPAPEPPDKVPARVNQYCLYIRYCEQPTDPVMPYSTGDDCGQQTCQATRMREGIKFELRCKPKHGAANPLIARLCACLGDLITLQRIAVLAQQLKSKNTNLTLTFNQTPDASFNQEGLAKLNQAIQSLDMKSPVFTENLGIVVGIVNGFDALPANEQTALGVASPGFKDALDQGREKIQLARAAFIDDSRRSFEEIQDWLIRRLDNTPYLTDCTLRQRVTAMALPGLNVQSRNPEPLRSFANASDKLAVAFFDYVRDCLCRALNPACEPCEDSGVLLACFEVQKCKVVKVCNLERTFVLSPAAVRYWLPPLQLLGNLVETLCCAPFDSLFTNDREGRKRFNINQLLEAEVGKILTDSLCGFKTEADWVNTVASRISSTFRSDASRVATAAAEASVGSPNAAPSEAPNVAASEAASVQEPPAAAVTMSAPADASTAEAPSDSSGAETETEVEGEDQVTTDGGAEIVVRKRPRKPKAQS